MQLRSSFSQEPFMSTNGEILRDEACLNSSCSPALEGHGDIHFDKCHRGAAT